MNPATHRKGNAPLRAPNVSAEERLLKNLPRTLIAELLDKLDQAVREKPAQ